MYPRRMRERLGEPMTVRRLIVIASAVICGCVLVVVGCGSSDATLATTETSELYPVSVDGKWGYIETSGIMVVQPQFDDAHPFSDGLATVGKFSEDGPLFGYIDKTGTLVIPMRYGFPSDFSEGLCMVPVEENGTQTSGYIDKTGTMVIEPEFTMAGDFSEGLAGVMSAADNSRCGYIDKNGDWVIELPGNLIPGGRLGEEGFSESLAVVRELILDDPGDGGFRYGYIDSSGAVVIKPQFTLAFDFSEGLAMVAVKENGATKWGYIDKTGAWVIQPHFDSAGFFSEGLAAVGVRTSGTDSDATSITDYSWGYIDKTGRVVIPMQYQTADPFSGGVARVEDWAQVEGPSGAELVSAAYIDTTGKVIWQGK